MPQLFYECPTHGHLVSRQIVEVKAHPHCRICHQPAVLRYKYDPKPPLPTRGSPIR